MSIPIAWEYTLLTPWIREVRGFTEGAYYSVPPIPRTAMRPFVVIL